MYRTVGVLAPSAPVVDDGSPECNFLEACTSTPATSTTLRHVRAFATLIRVALAGDERPLRDLMAIDGPSIPHLHDVLAAAEFAVKEDLFEIGISDFAGKVRQISELVRRLRATEPLQEGKPSIVALP